MGEWRNNSKPGNEDTNCEPTNWENCDDFGNREANREAGKRDEKTDSRKLVEAAISMMEKSYAPYSRFHVGAALLGTDGRVYTGCNIENSSFGATNCAERTALFKAVSEGCRSFLAIAVVGGPEGVIQDYTPPCGICRQALAEFCDPGTFRVILAKSPDDRKEMSLGDLLPLAFTSESM